MALESACIPIPSEAIMPFAGALITARPGARLQPARPGLCRGDRQPARLHPRLLGRTQRRAAVPGEVREVSCSSASATWTSPTDFFHKYGEATVLFSRVLPDRPDLHLPAGGHRPDELRQVLRSTRSSARSPSATCSPGWARKYGQHLQTVNAWLHKADAAIMAVLVVLFAVWLWHHLRPDPDEQAGEPAYADGGTKSPGPS